MAYRHAVEFSDDPDTQNGAILVSRGGIIVRGANRFPNRVRRDDARLVRPAKYAWIEHAERDVIFAAASLGVTTEDATLYCPWFACPDCARAIIQSGISEVVGHDRPFSLTPDRWIEPIETARQMLSEAGVRQTIIPGDTGVPVRFNGSTVAM